VIRVKTGSRWRFSTLRLLGFVTVTCIALALGVAFPPLIVVWGLLWLFVSISLFRLGTLIENLTLLACGIVVLYVLALLAFGLGSLLTGTIPGL
jgi:hypothetical protein